MLLEGLVLSVCKSSQPEIISNVYIVSRQTLTNLTQRKSFLSYYQSDYVCLYG